MYHLMSLLKTWAFLGAEEISKSDLDVNPKSKNSLFFWWFHLSKDRNPGGGPGKDPGR